MAESKAKISISLDADLLRRLDAVCEAKGEERSPTIERMLRLAIQEQEEFIRDMEDPVMRTIHSVMMRSPAVMKTIVMALGAQFTADEIADIQKRGVIQRERGVQRQRAKRGPKSKEATA